MKFEIRKRNGERIWIGEASCMATAVQKAISKGANLGGANLGGANLGGADLRSANLGGADLRSADLGGADLRSANLRSANLRSANLRGADLRSADLGGADLGGANLGGADLRGAVGVESWIEAVREDVRKVLDSAPEEVPGVLAALRAGKVEGSTYEGPCACLVGTIANLRGVDYGHLPGLNPDASRPAEKWFLQIHKGDTPTNSPEAAIAAAWVEEWLTEKAAEIQKARVTEAAFK